MNSHKFVFHKTICLLLLLPMCVLFNENENSWLIFNLFKKKLELEYNPKGLGKLELSHSQLVRSGGVIKFW